MADDTELTQPGAFEGRTRLALRTELGNRRKAAGAWEAVWAEAGIKLAHHAMPGVTNSGFKPSDPMALLNGLDAGRVAPDDLVAIHSDGAPDDVNQHLRRVVTTIPANDGSGCMTALLGEAVPRDKWPLAMLRETVPVVLEATVRGTAVLVSRNGKLVSEIAASERDVGIWKGYVEAMLVSAVRAGKEDALRGREAGSVLAIRRSKSGSGALIWEVRDDRGRSYANDTRPLLQRRPTQRIENLMDVARRAYDHAFSETRYEDRIASQMFAPDDAGDGGPGESEMEARSYGGP